MWQILDCLPPLSARTSVACISITLIINSWENFFLSANYLWIINKVRWLKCHIPSLYLYFSYSYATLVIFVGVGLLGKPKKLCNFRHVRKCLWKNEAFLSKKSMDKLGLSWAKLNSNWNWNWVLLDLRFAALSWLTRILPCHTSTPTYLHISLLNCLPACLLAYLLSYIYLPIQETKLSCNDSQLPPLQKNIKSHTCQRLIFH